MGEYKHWGCVYWCPPETETGDRVNDIPRGVIAKQVGNLKGLPVDTFHNPKNAVGYISDSYQCSTHGSLFVEVAIPRGKPVNDITIGLIETGKLKGLSLAHDPSTLERKIVSVGLTPHPGRRNTVFFPSSSGSTTAQRQVSRLAMFSEFDMLERQAAEIEATKKMSEQPPAAPVTQPPATHPPPPPRQPRGAAPRHPPPTPTPTITDEQQLTVLNELAKSPDESVRMMAAFSLRQLTEKTRLAKELEGTRGVVEQQTGEIKEWIAGNWTKLSNLSAEKQAQLKEAEQTLLNEVSTNPTLRAAVYKIQLAQKATPTPPPPQQPDRVAQSLTQPQPSQGRIDQLALARSLMSRDNQGRFTAGTPSKVNNTAPAPPMSSYATSQVSRAATTNPAPVAAFSSTEAEQNVWMTAYLANRDRFGNNSGWSGVQVIQDRDWKTFKDPNEMVAEDESRSRSMMY